MRKYLSKTLAFKVLVSPRPTVTLKFMMELLFSRRKIDFSFAQRRILLQRFLQIENNIFCGHSFDELLIPACKILEFPPSLKGCIVEAGAYKGGGTAKLSVVAKMCNRKLYVFDSFEGLPENDEPVAHTTMGYSVPFNKGDYAGSLDEVKDNIKKFGEIDVCYFIKGNFDKTMPEFKENENIAAVFCDVDLASSNKTCLKYLWPNLVNGGIFFSQDAHIPIVQMLFADKAFWTDEIGQNPPPFMHFTKRFGYLQKY